MGTIIVPSSQGFLKLMGKGMNMEMSQTELFVGIMVYAVGHNVLRLWWQNN